ncbi:flavohemoglobin expression-modulating QEGLA motif protein [Tessaracoccus sp. OS52]|uniref:flavohemoglobin expression-modulating QEGLA motif protein n=1 Tax=Tessaracoccus sp. OS52 TaxID=2886691 RepID=UPI001D117C1F|nr:tyrosine/phenylalanine carboxypeptidase domain-containing protein [Tessaracoccus sp. OS52]MCC2593863.1 flavohemoglobin expression-modulating QEGLA motif protein [Tessaracoccus sp. OS52]
MSPANPLATIDQAIDHELSQLGTSFRFILDVTPVDADDVREAFLAGEVAEPEFSYRELSMDPEVAQTILEKIDVGAVQDNTVAALLRSKHRELELQLAMLRARNTPDFRPLSIELYGGVAPNLLTAAESILERVEPVPAAGDHLDAEEFLELAEAEIEHYRESNPDIDIHAEIRHDSTGVMVSENVLLIGPEARVATVRANALIQHEVGTHLVTQVNGAHQPLMVLGTGLAGYDETQEGLAVLAEIAVGALTPGRLRQLAGRVMTVHDMTEGASFTECFRKLVEVGVPRGSAFTTTMRVFRAGGLTKDAIYLRGLLELLEHLRKGGSLEAFFLGKFALEDLPLVEELNARGILHEPVLLPRWYDHEESRGRLEEASRITDPTQLIQGSSPIDEQAEENE